MPATVSVNKLTVVHKSSDGLVSFLPDPCLTPAPPAPPVPIPYPNIAMSQDTDKGSKTVKVDGNPIMLQDSEFSKSTGDEAGSVGGVASGVTKGKAKFVNYSFDVMVDGKNVPRMGDMMLGNQSAAPNTPPMPEVQPPSIVIAVDQNEDDKPDELKIILTDRAGNAVKDAKYVLELPDGKTIEGKTDASGKITVDDPLTGRGRLVFPELGGNADK